jgi:tripartite-type tricarboxylate transporter receptor subunit TctC
VPQAPDLPTIAEQGYPKFETDSWYGIVAPTATAKDAVTRMNAELNRALADPVLRTTLVERGLQPIGGTQDKLASHIHTEIAKYADIVKQAHIKID